MQRKPSVVFAHQVPLSFGHLIEHFHDHYEGALDLCCPGGRQAFQQQQFNVVNVVGYHPDDPFVFAGAGSWVMTCRCLGTLDNAERRLPASRIRGLFPRTPYRF